MQALLKFLHQGCERRYLALGQRLLDASGALSTTLVLTHHKFSMHLWNNGALKLLSSLELAILPPFCIFLNLKR